MIMCQCSVELCALMLDVEMMQTLLLLPLLLPEAPFAVTGMKGKRKRNVWKPSVLETMEHFVDVQKVFILVNSVMM